MTRHNLLALSLAASLTGVASGYSLYEPPRLLARPDYGLNVVFLEEWRGSVYLGLRRVLPIADYLDYQLKQSVVDAWLTSNKRNRERAELTAEPAGLIPDIELPKLPLFGEGSRIDISGQDRITVGGSQTNVEGGTRLLGNQRLFPELKMEQQLAVSLNGTIGDRTKVTIDHDSQRQEGQNKVKLTYTGVEDDVVQSIEMGDTRLAIPGTGYTGDLPAHHGLFGVSAKGKLAGIDIYGIASREESQSQSQSFSGQRRVSVDTIYDVEYQQLRFFQVPYFGRINNIRVYVDDRNGGNNQAAFKSVATIYPDRPEWRPDTALREWTYDRAGGDFDLKSPGTDYLLHPGNVLEFTPALNGREIVGLAIYTDSGNIGGGSWHDSLVLKLLKPEVTDSLSSAWDYELRNFYALGRSDVRLQSLKILRRHDEQFTDFENDSTNPGYGRKFVELLGLDPDGDGRIEYPQFDAKPGLIRFPDTKPFASSRLAIRDSIIYRLDPDVLPPELGRQYRLVAEYSSATESYYLGTTGITENSERVTVNGQIWTRDGDYSVDYRTGILTFTRPLPPNADIKITYEYRPLFMASQKSLIGTRAEWKYSPGGKVGTSVFYRSEGNADEKPLLGNEPFRRMIAEADVSYGTTSDAVTAFLDRLPLVRAQTPTSFSIAAEGAISQPDPNTRGVAYLDDFEQTINSHPLSTTALLWSHASAPVGRDTTDFARVPLRWETPATKIRKDSVYGPGLGEEGKETQDVLAVRFTPDAGRTGSWAGLMIAPTEARLGMNFREIENLEFVLRSRRRHGNLHVSIGMSIDEDAPRRTRSRAVAGFNGRLDTEDRNGNGMLDEIDEDTGLDSVFGADSLPEPVEGDDGNDDYDPATLQNGTEGNRRLDSEDIDGNGFSRYNHYFECTIPLGDPRFATELFNGWQRYRFALHDSSAFRSVGSPKWEDIRVIRLWFDGFEQPDTIEFYSLEFVGSKWRNPRIGLARDSTTSERPPQPDPGFANRFVLSDTTERVRVAQVSRKTDTSYTPPFEPKRNIYGEMETEAALEFAYFNLRSNRLAHVSRSITAPEDYRDYQTLRVYIHDDTNNLEFLLRVGTDSINYYEYRADISSGQLLPGRDGKWFEFAIPLDSFAPLKPARDSYGSRTEVWRRGQFAIRGSPSLAEVRYTAMGIVNTRMTGQRITGSVWFNDIRLTGPRRQTGLGLQSRAGLTLSDLGGINLAFNYSDPNFRSFSEGRAIKTGGFGTNFSGVATANVHQLLPHNWGLVLPITYARSEQRLQPKYAADYVDLRAGRAQAMAEMTQTHSQDFSLDNLRKTRSSAPWLNYTLEAMSFSWRRRNVGARSILRWDSTASQSTNWSYSVNPDVKIRLGPETDLYLLPRSFRLGLSDGWSRRMDSVRIRVGDSLHADSARSHGLSSDLSLDFSPLEDLTVDYSVETERDHIVTRPDTFIIVPIGSEASRSENIGASYEIEIGDVLTPSVDFDGQYDHDRPKLDTVYAPYRNLSNSGEFTFSAGVDIPELLQRIGDRGDKQGTPGQASPASPRTGDSLSKLSRPPVTMRQVSKNLAGIIDALDISYSISHSSEYGGATRTAPWYYRLGLTDTMPFDSLRTAQDRSREARTNLRCSGGARYRDFSLRASYDRSQGRDAAAVGGTLDRSLVWPSIDLSLAKVHSLFSAWATDSRLSSSFRRRADLSGELLRDEPTGRESLGMFGRIDTRASDFNPMLSWQTTWKKRVSTTLTVNYATTRVTNYLSETGDRTNVATTRTQGGNLSVSYSFSAPKGLVIPFLRRVRFSSDLSLNMQLRYSNAIRRSVPWDRPPSTDQNDHSFATTIGASYRFSRSIEAGLNTAYSENNNGITRTKTKRTDLDIWVLFRF